MDARVSWLESRFLRSEEDVTWEWGGLLSSWSGTRVVDSDMRVSLLYFGVESDFSSEVIWTVFIVASSGEYAHLRSDLPSQMSYGL
jgi:hypothetical protein